MKRHIVALVVAVSLFPLSMAALAGTCEIIPSATFQYLGTVTEANPQLAAMGVNHKETVGEIRLKLDAPIRCEDEAPCETASAIHAIGGTCSAHAATLGSDLKEPSKSACGVWDAHKSKGSQPAAESNVEHVARVKPGNRYRIYYDAGATINGCKADPSPNWQSHPINKRGTGYVDVPPAVNGVRLLAMNTPGVSMGAQNRLVAGKAIQIAPDILAAKESGKTLTVIVNGPGIDNRRIVIHRDGNTVASSINDIVPTKAGVLTLTAEISGKTDGEEWAIQSEPFSIPVASTPCPAKGVTAYMDPNAKCGGK
ncbi:MAG: hypothetical protein LBT74_01085 [Acidobacteriota bacterium]|jgi:hypothetical protein|nr:hypothetical protein [Acidobacteriota bacterium]